MDAISADLNENVRYFMISWAYWDLDDDDDYDDDDDDDGNGSDDDDDISVCDINFNHVGYK